MKNIQLRVWTLAATVILTGAMGCNKKTAYITTDTPMAITAGVAEETAPEAAASKAPLRTAFENGETLGLYVVAYRKPNVPGVLEKQYNYADNAKATYASSGSSWTIVPVVYFPTVEVDVYGYAPYNAGTSFTDPAAYEFTVTEDQSDGTKIRNNDLLTAIATKVTSTTSKIPMTFYHRLSRAEVKFKLPKTFKGKTIEKVESVTFQNFNPTAVVDLKTKYTYTIDGGTTGGTYPKPATSKIGVTPINITPNVIQTSTPGSNATNGTEYYIYEALVPPQTLAQNVGFVQIKVTYDAASGGGTETFNYINTTAASVFQAAKSTVLTLSFQADYTILLGTVSIAQWGTGGNTSGEVVPREVFNKFTITLPSTESTKITSIKLTTKSGTANPVTYTLPATHTAGEQTVTCAFDGTIDSPEYYPFEITKVEWLSNSNTLGTTKKVNNTDDVTLTL